MVDENKEHAFLGVKCSNPKCNARLLMLVGFHKTDEGTYVLVDEHHCVNKSVSEDFR